MAFDYVVTSRAGTPLGELRNAKARGVGVGVNRNSVAAATIRMDDPLADTILSGATLLKVYEVDPLYFAGPQLRATCYASTYEEVASGDGSGGTLAFTFAGPLSILGERLLGKTAAGYASGTALAPRDKALMAADVLTAANLEGYTGIDLGAVTNTGTTGFVAYPPFKMASEALGEIVNQLDGPDYELKATEPTSTANGVRIATLDFKPVVGQTRPAAVFEYGTGRRNALPYRRAGAYAIRNALYSVPGGTVPGAPVLSAVDAASIAAYGRHEGLVNVDLASDALRQQFTNEALRVQKSPRQIVTFQPAKDDPSKPGRVPKFGVDYFVGDLIPFRAVVNGVVRINGYLRVYAVDFTIDEAGDATPVLTLTAD